MQSLLRKILHLYCKSYCGLCHAKIGIDTKGTGIYDAKIAIGTEEMLPYAEPQNSVDEHAKWKIMATS